MLSSTMRLDPRDIEGRITYAMRSGQIDLFEGLCLELLDLGQWRRAWQFALSILERAEGPWITGCEEHKDCDVQSSEIWPCFGLLVSFPRPDPELAAVAADLFGLFAPHADKVVVRGIWYPATNASYGPRIPNPRKKWVEAIRLWKPRDWYEWLSGSERPPSLPFDTCTKEGPTPWGIGPDGKVTRRVECPLLPRARPATGERA
jgi:hypothetical protein